MRKRDYRTPPGDRHRCPDCRGGAVATVSAMMPGAAHPSVRHDPTCPVSRYRERLFASDCRWLDAHPGELQRLRHLHDAERTEIAAALGTVVTREQRRSWVVLVRRHPDLPGALVRGYYFGGRLHAEVAVGREAAAS